jgi:malonyl-CoA/methylmalonyl-CoA synthetase
MIAGSSLRLLPHFTPDGLLRAIWESRATALFAVPTMYQRMAAVGDPSGAGSELRLAVSGSAPLNDEVAAGAERLLGIVPLVRYGTTESGLDTSHLFADAREPRRSDTIGVALPGLEVRLVGEDGAELGPDGEGEIQVRGPQVCGGYWMDAEATAAAFAPGDWFRTGDIGRLDQASGHLVVRGRSKEVIITGGLNVYPREVEIALEKHPAVAEAAVAGVPHSVWGEQVTAWIVLRPGHTAATEEILEHARGLLAPFKCPKHVYRLDALPRNHAGKIDRRRLTAAR